MKTRSPGTAAQRIGEADAWCVVALADGSIATSTRDGVVTIATAGKSKARKLTKPSKDPMNVYTLAASPDGALLAFSSKGLTVFDTATREALYRLEEGFRPAFSRDGETLAMLHKNVLLVANARTGRSVRHVAPDWVRETGAITARIHAIAFSPDGRSVVAGGEGGRLRFFDLEKSVVAKTVEVRPLPTGPLSAVAWSAQGRLACAGWGAGVHLRERDGSQVDLDCTAWLGRDWPPDPGDSAETTGICFSPDEAMVLSAFDARGRLPGRASWATLWDRKSGEALAQLVFERTVVRSVAFTPDGKSALLGCSSPLHRPLDADDGLWSWPTGK